MNNLLNIPEFEVSEFNKEIKNSIESSFNYVRIKGEISEIKTATKGQIYLTLKDDNSVLSGVIWKQKKSSLNLQPELGVEVIVTGKITTWSKFKTTYQIDIDNIEVSGEGVLIKLIEERKKRLLNKGYFDENKKKKIPFLPERVGVITSPTGSVIHDIINRINDRFPMPIDLWPVSVQGENAVKDISFAIHEFNSMKFEKPDLIIVARGGGSTEDLMAFNNEDLAKVVFESKIPIISAIGHETDNTIIDFVSDLRASTPTAAAEKAVPVKSEINKLIYNLDNDLQNRTKTKFKNVKDKYYYIDKFFKVPKNTLNNFNERLENTVTSINLALKNLLNINKINMQGLVKNLKLPENITNQARKNFKDLYNNMDRVLEQKYKNTSRNFSSISRLLVSNSISNNLKKGYSIITNNGKIVRDIKSVKKKDILSAKFYKGSVEAEVKKIN